MAADTDKLLEIATGARQILENFGQTTHNINFQDFPRGACGPAAELLGRYLVEAIGLDAQYVAAKRSDEWTHAWIVVNETIVDITADQFGEKPVIVTQESAWHDEWDQKAPRPPICSQKQWPAYPFSAWDAIVKGMAERGFPAPD